MPVSVTGASPYPCLVVCVGRQHQECCECFQRAAAYAQQQDTLHLLSLRRLEGATGHAGGDSGGGYWAAYLTQKLSASAAAAGGGPQMLAVLSYQNSVRTSRVRQTCSVFPVRGHQRALRMPVSTRQALGGVQLEEAVVPAGLQPWPGAGEAEAVTDLTCWAASQAVVSVMVAGTLWLELNRNFSSLYRMTATLSSINGPPYIQPLAPDRTICFTGAGAPQLSQPHGLPEGSTGAEVSGLPGLSHVRATTSCAAEQRSRYAEVVGLTELKLGCILYPGLLHSSLSQWSHLPACRLVRASWAKRCSLLTQLWSQHAEAGHAVVGPGHCSTPQQRPMVFSLKPCTYTPGDPLNLLYSEAHCGGGGMMGPPQVPVRPIAYTPCFQGTHITLEDGGWAWRGAQR
ncbi:protocadherin Fat 3 isoform X1 [Lates japonicus]|uniref:Protocadherin Fat 3 isoform X1 n=1 Tax=Lates japonicus TaxID=270547 RepID=A0AAD3ME11_LATJO|nr:protocadherin Fat 3 isoform X1 [Lates japonicus]